MIPSQEYLQRRFDYEPETGWLIWKEMLSLNQKELEALDALTRHRTFKMAAQSLGIGAGAFQYRIESARRYVTTGLMLPPHLGKRLPATFIGQRVGCIRPDGYVIVSLDDQHILAHRLIWMRECGEWPEELDHIDLNRANNRIDNLRIATRSQNNMNHPIREDNKCGFKGVYRRKDTGKYSVSIKIHGKKHGLGDYDDAREAHAAYCAASTLMHGKYGRTE